MRQVLLLIAISLLWGHFLWSAPKDPENYLEISNPANIPAGSYIEGSAHMGGIQPDYYFDVQSPEIQPILAKAKEIGRSQLDLWEKVDAIARYIREDVLKKRKYDDPDYRALVEEYRKDHRNIPLSRYVCIQGGVCRENALLLHFAMKEAGIPNQFAYAFVETEINGVKKAEDHAFTLVRYENELWIADSYDGWFHGYRYSDFLSPNGVGMESPSRPNAVKSEVRRRILQINSFPKIWIPKDSANCETRYRKR